MARRDILFRIRGEDDLTPAARRAGRSMDGLASDAKQAGSEIADALTAEVDIDTSGIDIGGIDKLTGSLGGAVGGFGLAAAATGAATGLYHLATGAAEGAREVGQMSSITGLSIRTLRGLGNLLEAEGWDLDDPVEGFKRFSEYLVLAQKEADAEREALAALGLSIEDLNTGVRDQEIAEVLAGQSREARQIFERLGLSWEDLRDKQPDELFLALADAIDGIHDPTERAGLLAELFGRDMDSVSAILHDTDQSMAGLIDQYFRLNPLTREQIEESEELLRRMTEVQLQMQQLGLEVLPALISGLNGAVSAYKALAGAARDYVSFHGEIVGGVADIGRGIGDAAGAVGGAVASAAGTVGGWLGFGGGGGGNTTVEIDGRAVAATTGSAQDATSRGGGVVYGAPFGR